MNVLGILFWDKIENYNIPGSDTEFKYAGVNPCGEMPLPDGGSCLLGSINLSEYVVEGKFQLPTLIEDLKIIVGGMNDVLEQGMSLHPLEKQRATVRDWRQIGIGIMGLADMLIKMGIKYDSEEALAVSENIAKAISESTLYYSSLLAKEYGAYPKWKRELAVDSPFIRVHTKDNEELFDLINTYGLRNSCLTTIAPTGTLSTMLGISGGIEPIFNLSYTRKTESLHSEGEKYYKVFTPIAKEYMEQHGLQEESELPSYFVTTQSIDPFKRVEMQGVWQRHIDSSISSTVNLPNEATIEEVEQLYIHAWKQGLKGMTIYRDGCLRGGVLTTEKEEEETKDEEELNSHILKRGEWKSLANDTYYVKKNITIGCGKLKLFIGYSPSEHAIQDLYVVKSGQGGCAKNLQALCIAMSGIFRLGGNIDNIEKAFCGIDACPSFARERAKGTLLSKGSYCGSAIVNVIKDFLQEDSNLIEVKGIESKVETTEISKEEEIPTVSHPFKVSTDIEAMPTDKEFIEKYGATAYVKKYQKCPVCGAKISHIGGCMSCLSCGYSKCD